LGIRKDIQRAKIPLAITTGFLDEGSICNLQYQEKNKTAEQKQRMFTNYMRNWSTIIFIIQLCKDEKCKHDKI